MRIAFLGLGKMGRAVARHLLEAGHQLTVWNRTPASAEELESQGAILVGTPAEAAGHAEVIFTMVMDDAALEGIAFDAGMIQAMQPGSVHVSLSTISVKLSDRLTESHR